MRDLINIINEAENHEEKILIIDNKVLKENNPLTNKKSMSLSEYINKQDMLKEQKMKIVEITEQEVNINSENLPDVFDLNKKVQVDSKDHTDFYNIAATLWGRPSVSSYYWSFTKVIDDKFVDYLSESDNLIKLYYKQPKIQEYIKNTWNEYLKPSWDENTNYTIARIMETAISFGEKSRDLKNPKVNSTTLIIKYLKLYDLIEELGMKDIIPIIFPTYKDIMLELKKSSKFFLTTDENGCSWNSWDDIRDYDICVDFNKNIITISPKTEDEDDEYNY
jgi:hypothetical protein